MTLSEIERKIRREQEDMGDCHLRKTREDANITRHQMKIAELERERAKLINNQPTSAVA